MSDTTQRAAVLKNYDHANERSAVLTQRSAEWNEAWDTLAAQPFNDYVTCRHTAECPESGERWQYLGTYLVGGSWVHQFRHRHHPTWGQRMVCNVEVNRAP